MASVRATDWLDALSIRGRAHFTFAEAAEELGSSHEAVGMALSRLRRRSFIATPYRGFYLILTPEYRALGCLPADQFLDQLMAWLDEPYYAGLLSAAAYHGAAHQRPQRFQAIVPRSRRPVTCGGVHIDFVARKDMASTPTESRNTRTGYLRVATAEATALELVGFANRSGGLDNVATVLAELGEVLRPDRLLQAAQRCPIAWVQRLGWLLERVDRAGLAAALLPEIGDRANVPAPLLRSASTVGRPRDPRWRVIVNAKVEPDEL